MKILASVAAAGLVIWFPLAAGADEPTFNDDININLELQLRDLDGKTHRPLHVGDDTAHVLIFSTIDCPIANYYVPELKKLANEFRDSGIRFFVVHCDPYLTTAAAREHRDEYQYTLPIMLDLKHELVRTTGASHTPEAFVVLPGGKLAYRGCIDDMFADLGKKRRSPRYRYLHDTLAEVVAGKPVTNARTKAVGCIIDVLPATGTK